MGTVKTFGEHVAASDSRRRGGSAMAVFSRGIQAGLGNQWRFRFANGYGASVIDDGYGHETGLYELAVLGIDGHLTYDTPITDDVLGWLSEDDVAKTLDRINALPDSTEAAS